MISLQPSRKRHLTACSLLAGILLACPASYASDDTNTDKSAAADKSSTPPLTVRLRAEVIDCANPELAKNIDDLSKFALDKIRQADLLEKEKHYKSGMSRLIASSKDIAELCTAYKGFEQSSEAADIILEEQLKLKSGSAVAYLKQKKADNTHEQLITSLMQIATGLGMTDPEQSKATIREGITELEKLTDKEQAEKAAEMLKNWCQSQKVLFAHPMAPMQIQAECHDIVGRAIQQDCIVNDVKASLHKYNRRSKLARTTAKVVNTTLSITSLSPTMISPASQIAWTLFIMTQGGPEESKLLKEVYLAKRFENRFQMLSNETNLAVNSYNSALMSQNAPLLAFSQHMIGQLCQPSPASAVNLASKLPGAKSGDAATKPVSKESDKDTNNKETANSPGKDTDKDAAAKTTDKGTDI